MKEEKDEKEKNEKTEEKDSKVEGETKDDAMTTFKEKLRAAGHRLAKLEAVLSERNALEGRKVTAKILAHKALRERGGWCRLEEAKMTSTSFFHRSLTTGSTVIYYPDIFLVTQLIKN